MTPQLTVQLVNGEPRVHDLMLANALGFGQPATIRQLIKRKEESLSKRGEVFSTVLRTSDLGGRPATEYWLTKWQAIKICMWSEAPNADLVQDDIADVFDAYTDGKLVPANQTPITADILGKMFEPIRKTIESTYEVAKGTDGKVVQLLTGQARIEQRMNDVIPRYDPSVKNQRIYLHTIVKCFGGCCPCGCKQKIVDENGNPLLDERGDPLLHYDHNYSRERNGIDACWPTHRDCNIKLRDDDYRLSKQPRYVVFHEERKTVQHEVRDPPRRKSEDDTGQMTMKFPGIE